MLNPTTPFVYREAEEMEPFVYARFGATRLLQNTSFPPHI